MKWIGLTDAAREFLAEHAARIPGDCCPKCGEVLNTKKDCTEREWVKDNDGNDFRPLIAYQLDDGRTAREVVQMRMDYCIFICLEIDMEFRFKWMEDA